MSITRIGAGKRMSEAVSHGGKVYLAGVVAEKTVGKSVKEQAADMLAQIDATLETVYTAVRELDDVDLPSQDIVIAIAQQLDKDRWFLTSHFAE